MSHFRLNGIDRLRPKSSKYIAQFKLQVLSHQDREQLSSRQDAAFYDIRNSNQVVTWRRKLDEGGIESLGTWEQGHSRMKNERRSLVPPSTVITDSTQVLREGNERLRAEVLDSTRRRNCSLKFTSRRFIVQRFSRPGIQAHGDGIQIGLTVAREVYSLRQVLANQSIGVLIGSTLTRASWITKENIDLD